MEITPDGTPLVFTKDEFLFMMTESKKMADNFHEIQLKIGSQDMYHLKEALEYLCKLLQVL